MRTAHLVYPHQLFGREYLPEGITTAFVIEDPLYFGTDQTYPVYFHKQKLMLHRASMRRYIEEVLWPAGYDVEYIEFKDLVESGDVLQRVRGYERVTVFDVVDDILQRRLQTASTSVPDVPKLEFLDSPNFYLKRQEVVDYFGKTTKSDFAKFYQWQRERWNILIADNYKPVGGKWSYDSENRKRLPKDHQLTTFEVYGSNKYVEEARHYVSKNFPDNPGSDEEFCWPTNGEEAAEWLGSFVKNRLELFGPYEDAIDGEAPWLYHSALSTPMNCGLLQPKQVVEAVLSGYEQVKLPLESVEGFVRQVLGWREYVRGLYITRGVSMRTSNVFEHKRSLTQDWYDGTTGIPPLDDVIKKVMQRGYMHHIERLMIVGNMMLLSEIDPKEVYQWFMELTVDAYDWVMVPNIYGMSQYADGGSMTTKPYASGSNYILQMSWYEKDVWCDIWDGLYWAFIEKHRTLFAHNPRMKVVVSQLDHMNEDRKRIIGYRAADFLSAKTKTTA